MNTQGTPIAWPLRAWLAVEVLFGIGAVMAIGVSPEDSATNFSLANSARCDGRCFGRFLYVLRVAIPAPPLCETLGNDTSDDPANRDLFHYPVDRDLSSLG